MPEDVFAGCHTHQESSSWIFCGSELQMSPDWYWLLGFDWLSDLHFGISKIRSRWVATYVLSPSVMDTEDKETWEQMHLTEERGWLHVHHFAVLISKIKLKTWFEVVFFEGNTSSFQDCNGLFTNIWEQTMMKLKDYHSVQVVVPNVATFLGGASTELYQCSLGGVRKEWT